MDLFSLIKSKIDERLSTGNDDSFYILDLSDVRLKYQCWTEQMPRVIPYYAVKCSDHSEIVKTLAELGTGFDCALKKELKQVLEMGILPDRIIYAHTVKQFSHLKFAADNGIDMLTFDSLAELEKIEKIHKKAKVVLRIRFDSKNSIICLETKFGCDPITEAPDLIKVCKNLDMNLVGISFHVVSGTLDYEIYESAIQVVRQLFDIAADFGFKLNIVDIGGGFIGSDISLLGNYAKSISRGIKEYFPNPSEVTIISEPGRYFVESAFILVVQIVLKKIAKDGHIHYYINESIYQSFMMIHLYKCKLQFKIIRKSKKCNESMGHLSTIWGQSCNSMDKIVDNEMIPELEIGDYLAFENMGAYTTTVSTHFNGFTIGEIITVESGKNEM